ncbi:MAG: NAD(P)-binding domain-containing protein [Phycisphaerales bacterium JB039]
MRSTDVAVIGAGPIGVELACAVKRAGVDYLHLEAKQVGATLMWWAPGTRFFSSPERLALAGIPLVTADQAKATGEEYLAYLRQVVLAHDLPIQRYTRVEEITRDGTEYELATRREGSPRIEPIRAKRLVLAIGNMHAPRLIGVPGETDRPDVSHYLADPHTYFGRRLLIVGGKNSAVEAAIRCWRAGAEVTMSYRAAAFDPDRIKYWLLPELEWLISKGRIRFLPRTAPVAFEDGAALLAPLDDTGAPAGDPIRHECDFTLLLTGYVQDQTLFDQLDLKRIGDERKPVVDPQTMETSSPGVYVAGTASGGSQRRARVFIETSHVHVDRIVAALTGAPAPAAAADEHAALPES